MKRQKFIFRESYQQAVDLIDDIATKTELLLAITEYGMKGKAYEGDNKLVKIAMTLIMPQIDKENRRYEIKEESETAGQQTMQPTAIKTVQASKTNPKPKTNPSDIDYDRWGLGSFPESELDKISPTRHLENRPAPPVR